MDLITSHILAFCAGSIITSLLHRAFVKKICREAIEKYINDEIKKIQK